METNSHTPVPATEEIMNKLPKEVLEEGCESILGSRLAFLLNILLAPLLQKDCAICKDQFSTHAEEPDEHIVVTLPCKHPYHKSCILPWLQSNGTCPVCRLAKYVMVIFTIVTHFADINLFLNQDKNHLQHLRYLQHPRYLHRLQHLRLQGPQLSRGRLVPPDKTLQVVCLTTFSRILVEGPVHAREIHEIRISLQGTAEVRLEDGAKSLIDSQRDQ